MTQILPRSDKDLNQNLLKQIVFKLVDRALDTVSGHDDAAGPSWPKEDE